MAQPWKNFFAKKIKLYILWAWKNKIAYVFKILYAIIAGLSALVLAILGLLVYQNFKNSKTDNQVNSNSPDEATKDEK